MTAHSTEAAAALAASRGTGRVAVALLLLWLAAAVAAGVTGATTHVRGPVAALVILGGVGVLAAAYAVSRPFRAWALGVDPRATILLHTLRLVGIAFLVLHAQGRLPSAFAVPAGWGDITVAVLAPVVATAVPWRTAGRRRIVLAWNVVGFADILYAAGAGLRFGLADPDSMAAIWTWPFSLVPSFGVPLIIATHLLVFAQLGRRRAG